MTKPNKIAFLGLGKMASKMISRMMVVGNSERINGYSPSQRQMQHVKTHASIAETLNRNLEIVIYAFKPQNWNEAQKNTINSALQQNPKRPIIVSILAGLGIAELDCDIVMMPNVLCEVGHSFMFAHAKDSLTEAQKANLEELCKNMGPVFWVDSAEKMHMAVASSGSAPAYVLFAMDKAVKMYMLSGLAKQDARQAIINDIKNTSEFFKVKLQSNSIINWEDCYQELANNHHQIFIFRVIEAYCQAMHKLGLDMQTAYQVSWNTVYGTALLAENHPELELSDIMASIMSKGGTTEQAIAVAKTATFEIFASQDNLNNFVFSMLKAAYDKSILLKEASKKNSSDLKNQSMFKPTTDTQDLYQNTAPSLNPITP